MKKNIIVPVMIVFIIIILPSLSSAIDNLLRDGLKNEKIKDGESLQKKALVWGYVKRKVKNDYKTLRLAVITFIDKDDNYWKSRSGLIAGYYFIILPHGNYTVFTIWSLWGGEFHITIDTPIQNYNIILN